MWRSLRLFAAGVLLLGPLPAPADPGPHSAAGRVEPTLHFDSSDPKRFIYHQWMTLGRRASGRGRIPDAREYYTYAMELAYRFDPAEHHPFEDLGDVLAGDGQHPEAAFSYMEALRLLRAQGDAPTNREIVARIERKLGLLPEGARRAPKSLVQAPKPQPLEVGFRRPPEEEDDEAEVKRPVYTERRVEPRIERPRSGEPSPGAPWIDFDRMEMTVFPGIVDYSRDFSAGLSACGGALLHAPTPGVPAPLIDRLRLGGFGEIIVSNVDRDFTPALPDPSGATIFVAAGIDYTLVRDEEMFILGQGGLMYARFGGVTDLEDGVGVMVGGMGGLAVDQGIWLTYNPQIAFAPDHGDWIMFHLFGIQFQF